MDNTSKTPAPGRLRWVVAILAIIGIVPYVILKMLWISGSRIGIVDPEFGHGTTMILLNTATAIMDVIAVVLALSFVTTWGRRIPAPVVLLPMWVATGLLGQIALVLPLQLVLGGQSTPSGVGSAALAPWVPAVVYGGFAWQGIFLIVGFALYAHARWGARVLASRPRDSCHGFGMLVPLAIIGTLVAAALAIVFMGSGRLEAINAVVSSVIALSAGIGVLLLTPRSLRLECVGLGRVVCVGLGWFGSGALFAWGSYLTLVALVPNDLQPEGGIVAAGVAQTIVMALVGALCAVVLLRSVVPVGAKRPVSSGYPKS